MLTVAERLEADYISGLEYATLEGLEIGRQEGRQEGIEIGTQKTVETINLLLKQGFSIEEALEKIISK